MDIIEGQKITIPQMLSQFTEVKAVQMNRILQDGFTEGLTQDQLISRVREIEPLQRRQAAALVRTGTNSVSSIARYRTAVENSDVLDGYEWVSTLDDRTSLVCASRDGMVYEFTESSPKPPAHWNCVLGDTLITSAIGVSCATKRIFKGKVVTIETVSGNKLTVTPNHPILTSNGWLRADLIKVGHKCVTQAQAKGVRSIDGDNDSPFKKAKNVFESLGASRHVLSAEMEVSSPDFHGDGVDNEVAEIRAAGNLSGMVDVGIIEPLSKRIFNHRDISSTNSTLQRLCALNPFFKGCLSSLAGLMRSARKLLDFLFCGSIHSRLLLLRTISKLDSVLLKDSLNGSWTDAEGVCYSPNTYAGGVFLDDVFSVEISDFCDHVYNFRTSDHCFAANGIITHNCRSTIIPKVDPRYNLLSEVKGERPAIGAKGVEQVSGQSTYGGWLRKQPASFQNEALGPDRAKLFRQGGLSIGKFTNFDGRTYTLDELRALHPLAFEKANI
jgi:SPP1 gp7 family putative phage head morphogenesis protein